MKAPSDVCIPARASSIRSTDFFPSSRASWHVHVASATLGWIRFPGLFFHASIIENVRHPVSHRVSKKIHRRKKNMQRMTGCVPRTLVTSKKHPFPLPTPLRLFVYPFFSSICTCVFPMLMFSVFFFFERDSIGGKGNRPHPTKHWFREHTYPRELDKQDDVRRHVLERMHPHEMRFQREDGDEEEVLLRRSAMARGNEEVLCDTWRRSILFRRESRRRVG